MTRSGDTGRVVWSWWPCAVLHHLEGYNTLSLIGGSIFTMKESDILTPSDFDNVQGHDYQESEDDR